MRTALLALALVLTMLAGPPAAQAQASKIHRIGFLGVPPTVSFSAVFRRGLRELGYREGENILIEQRWAEGQYDRLAAFAAELVRLNADVIVTSSTPETRAAMDATTTIPIVMGVSGDPVATGLTSSLARPSRNVTGLSMVSPELGAKRLELLREIAPKVARVAVLWNPANPAQAPLLKEVDAAAPSLGLKLHPLGVRAPAEIDNALSAILKQRADALYVFEEPVFFIERTRIAAFAIQHRLPTIFGFRDFVEAGGLMSYGPNLSDLFRRAAIFVDKILKGAKPADLPIEQPTTFELVINGKTAKALGLTIPQSLLVRADEVIK